MGNTVQVLILVAFTLGLVGFLAYVARRLYEMYMTEPEEPVSFENSASLEGKVALELKEDGKTEPYIPPAQTLGEGIVLKYALEKTSKSLTFPAYDEEYLKDLQNQINQANGSLGDQDRAKTYLDETWVRLEDKVRIWKKEVAKYQVLVDYLDREWLFIRTKYANSPETARELVGAMISNAVDDFKRFERGGQVVLGPSVVVTDEDLKKLKTPDALATQLIDTALEGIMQAPSEMKKDNQVLVSAPGAVASFNVQNGYFPLGGSITFDGPPGPPEVAGERNLIDLANKPFDLKEDTGTHKIAFNVDRESYENCQKEIENLGKSTAELAQKFLDAAVIEEKKPKKATKKASKPKAKTSKAKPKKKLVGPGSATVSIDDKVVGVWNDIELPKPKKRTKKAK